MKIEEILKENCIDYVTAGKNVSRNNLGLNCPFCGDDSTYHLGINPEKGVFSCWRNSTHKGTIAYLVSYLLMITIEEARVLLGEYTPSLEGDKKIVFGGKKEIKFYDGFRPIEDKIATRIYFNYLKSRGFDRVDKLIERYDLKCSFNQNKWDNRIIFPIYMDEKLMTWIGRDISTRPYLRYRDLDIDQSVRHAKYCLFDYDNLVGGERLYVLEGVFDAMKINWYTGEDISSTCVFTINMTDEQISLLSRISERYNKIILLFDSGAELSSISLGEKISFIKNLEIKFTPYRFKDVGEMSKNDIRNLI